MRTAPLRSNDDVKLGLLVSLGAHFVLVALLLIRNVLITDVSMDSLPAIRVDMVALPDKISTLTPPPPADESKPEAKAPPEAMPAPVTPESAKPALPPKEIAKTEPDTINLKKTKASQKAALDRLKNMQALEKIENDLKKETSQAERKRLEALAAASRAQAGDLKLKGNQLAAGTELTGVDRLQHDEYRIALDRHIKPFWQLPEWLTNKSLSAQVLIRLDGEGRLISKQLIKASGNRDFDDSVLLTIDRAAPLPAPPEKFISKVSLEGIILQFGQ